MNEGSEDKSENLVILPSGKTFKRKIFSKYTDDELKSIVAECSNIKHITTTLKLNAVYHYKIKDFIDKNKLSIAHFKVIQQNQYYNHTPHNGKTIRSNTHLKKRLLDEKKLINKCAICKMDPIWNNKPITLQLDHINGDHFNNNIENLRLLCPNCHSQTDTYTGRNCKKNDKKRRKCSECKIASITQKNNNGICKSCRPILKRKGVNISIKLFLIESCIGTISKELVIIEKFLPDRKRFIIIFVISS